MQIFLTKNETFFIGSSVKIVFNGKRLLIYVDNTLINSLPAKIGESFYVKSKGIGRKPKIKKIKLPTSRGKKISYFLFENAKQASSRNEVIKKANSIKSQSGILIIRNSYAVLFSEKRNKEIEAVISYVSDTISNRDLKELINETLSLKRLISPEEFILSL